MKDRKFSYRIRRINKLRQKLYRLLETEHFTSSNVLRHSRELDSLILQYYTKQDHELNEP
ncbi:MAG: aspartyl-phosphate phosphatase Spo0E family protein [Clostridiaceae bacterium]|nr:aspartyl-phosphate phosphatase Spo0E family protein [Clostridiaceae bacterium]